MEENKMNLPQEGKHWLEKISFGIVSLISFLVPVFFVSAPFISPQFATGLLFGAGVIVAVLAYLIQAFKNKSIEAPSSMRFMLGVFILAPAVYILAGLANGFSRLAFLGYVFDFTAVGFVFLTFAYMFLVSVLFKKQSEVMFAYLAFLAGAALLGLFILLRLIFGADFLSFGVFTDLTGTPLGNWNNVAIFFGAAALLVLLAEEMSLWKKMIKIVLGLLLAVFLLLLALVGFRPVWIILAVCLFIFMLRSLSAYNNPEFSPTLKQKLLKVPKYSLVVFVISVLFAIGGSSAGNYLSARLKVSNFEVRPSFTATMNVAKNTLETRPLFGAGPNGFVNQWLAYKPSTVPASDFWNADFAYGSGLFPTLLVTTGILGVLSWLIFLVLYLHLGVKAMFMRLEDLSLRYLLTSSFLISLFFWIILFLYVPSTAVFILSFFFTGLFFASLYNADLVRLTAYSFSGSRAVKLASSITLILLLAATGLLGFGLFQNSEALWYFQKSSYAVNTIGDITASEDFMKKAIASVPYDVYYRALSEIQLAKLNAVVSQDQTKVKLETIQEQFNQGFGEVVAAGISATNADPLNYLNWSALGRIYEAVLPLKVPNAYENARFAYSEALRRNPKNPGLYLVFARMEATRGDLATAKQYALRAIQEKQNYLDAYYLLSQIEVADKNIQGAIESTAAALILSPTDPALFFQLGFLKYNNNDFLGAIEALEKSISLSPQYANARYFLGLSYELLNRRSDAINQFEEIQKTNPDNTEVAFILNNLREGKPPFAEAKPPIDNKPEKRAAPPVAESADL